MNKVLHTGLDIADALTCEHALTRIVARGTVSGWIEQLSDWVNDEVRRPGGDPLLVVQGMSMLFIQTIGSVAAQVSPPAGDQILKKALISQVEADLIKHMERTRELARP